MIDLLNWIFSDFWHFVGFTFLLWMLCHMLIVFPLNTLHGIHLDRCTVKINDQKLREYELRNKERGRHTQVAPQPPEPPANETYISY